MQDAKFKLISGENMVSWFFTFQNNPILDIIFHPEGHFHYCYSRLVFNNENPFSKCNIQFISRQNIDSWIFFDQDNLIFFKHFVLKIIIIFRR